MGFPDFAVVRDLIGFLTANCCQGVNGAGGCEDIALPHSGKTG